MPKRTLWLSLIALLVGGAWLLYSADDSPDLLQPLPDFSIEARPAGNRYLFDYAGILQYYREGAEKYLARISDRFQIEAVVVSIPDLVDAVTIEALAVDLVNNWEIGRDYQGRGLLLLLSQKEQAVKLEVAYQLEDVFTDAFTGHIEDLQLKPYFLDDDVGTGLIAVMEEIERRAQIKYDGDYDQQVIAQLDDQLLSGGAGAKRSLTQYRQESVDSTSSFGQAETLGAATPEEAWQIMLSKWSGSGSHIDKNIYTEMTRLAMGDPDQPDARTRKAVGDWLEAEYEVLQEGRHAVIWFGNREGWNYAPFLFCQTDEGWKFDIVYQRRLVVMTENPHWKIAQGDYPYVNLLSGAKQSTNKDLPLAPADIYSCDQDKDIAQRIARLQQQTQREPDNVQAVMALARLNVLTGQRPNVVTPLLEKAKQLDAASPEPYRYSAIYNVNTFIQYQTALADIAELLKRRPDDLFANNMQGFLHYRLGDYSQSLKSLERALEIEPDNVYALALMARNYTLLYNKTSNVDPRRNSYLEFALSTLQRAEHAGTPNRQRVARLKSWMGAWGVL